ncbi:MAG: hypothetical protein Q7T48_07615 [Cellvibrio sp.]|uniref:hypothetical protein n=1 Tax=Cellvibrio sp. TaxID=1965322 RepID=UPI00271C927B|nr:hypothetical protein [Cellvibrio sp.]
MTTAPNYHKPFSPSWSRAFLCNLAPNTVWSFNYISTEADAGTTMTPMYPYWRTQVQHLLPVISMDIAATGQNC